MILNDIMESTADFFQSKRRNSFRRDSNNTLDINFNRRKFQSQGRAVQSLGLLKNTLLVQDALDGHS